MCGFGFGKGVGATCLIQLRVEYELKTNFPTLVYRPAMFKYHQYGGLPS